MPSSDFSSAYASMLENLEKIEIALVQDDGVSIKHLAQSIDRILEEIKLVDSQQVDSTDDSNRQLMRKEILNKNKAITARIFEIMAMQRIELRQITKGRDTAKGYSSYRSTQTGAIINSAN